MIVFVDDVYLFTFFFQPLQLIGRFFNAPSVSLMQNELEESDKGPQIQSSGSAAVYGAT